MRSPALLLLTLAACAPTVSRENVGPYPANWREQLAAEIRQSFFDPYTLRDVAVSEPSMGHLGQRTGWVVCLRANGKNRMGAYTGVKDTVYLLRDGALTGGVTDFNRYCQTLEMRPWPEMEAQANSAPT